MKYTAKQIENAKRAYNAFLQYTTAKEDTNYIVNPFEAERRAEYHNSIVSKILAGDKELEKEWKLFFCNEEAKKDAKAEASKDKLQANKAASADILEPIKSMRKLGEFGKWLNTSGNPYRKQHFNKKYTVEAVNEFLATL
jgi:signal recognition particle GTPase